MRRLAIVSEKVNERAASDRPIAGGKSKTDFLTAASLS